MAAEPASCKQFTFVLVLLGASGAACGDDRESSCVDDLPVTCSPAFTPNWAGVYQKVIVATCAAGQGARCHGPEQGSLEMSSSSGAYAALLGKDGTRARVIPNDPSCSILMERVTSTDSAIRMPRGGKLSSAQICAIQQWIEQGADP